MDSYKTKLDTLEVQSSAHQREATALRVELERAQTKLAASEEGRARDREALVLFEERVKELELGQGAKKGAQRGGAGEDDEDDEGGGVGDELDDALSGTTTTDLKLQVRRLQRELDRARGDQADSSRLVVLENLLDDATRMKRRYEGDYLKEHRDKLVLGARLEEIMSGRSKLGDGCVPLPPSCACTDPAAIDADLAVSFARRPEAAFALRQRLNEVVDELDMAKRELAALEVKAAAQERELTIAKSDRASPSSFRALLPDPT